MNYPTIIGAAAVATVLAGCGGIKNADSNALMQAGGSAYKAMSLTDGDVAAMSDQSCAAMDSKNQIAPANSRYTTRLNQVVRSMPSSVNGKPANYKVYLTRTSTPGPWPMAASASTAA